MVRESLPTVRDDVDTIEIRLAPRSELVAMAAIDDGGPDAMCAATLLHRIQQGMTTALSATTCGRVVGFLVYEKHGEWYELVRMAVHPQHRRGGIGTAMLAELKNKLHPQTRRAIESMVRETDLPELLFLRSAGFMATEMHSEWFDDSGEDGILMRYVSGGG